MTDRELLELAANAAGKVITGWNTRYGVDVAVLDDGSYWQPLLNNSITDTDGDALRLAVALRINIWLEKTLTIVEVCSDGDSPNLVKKEYCDAETQMAATRRAIVRAAAEIGKAM